MRSLGVVGLCCLVSIACGTHPPPAPGVDSGPRPDAFRDDAGRDTGASNDANDDVFGDANANDAGFMPGSCMFDAAIDLFEVDSDPRARSRVIGLGAGAAGFALTYSKVGTDGFENVYFAELPSSTTGLVPPPVQLTTDFAIAESPTVSHSATGWLVAWASNRAATMDIYALGSGPDGHMLTSPQRLTTMLVQEDSPRLVSSSTGNLLAWIERDGTGGNPQTLVQSLSDDAMLQGSASRLTPAGFTLRPQAMTPSDFGFAIGWCDPALSVVVQPIDPTGASSGTPMALTSTPESDGTVDLVVSNGGGAAVFGADAGGGRSEVHARLVDGAGAPSDVERVLTIGSDSGSDASIAELGGGYAVAYRQAGTPPTLRVLFLSSNLDEIGRLDLLQVAPQGGQTAIRVAGDGAVMVAWADIVGSVTQIRGARIRCN